MFLGHGLRLEVLLEGLRGFSFAGDCSPMTSPRINGVCPAGNSVEVFVLCPELEVTLVDDGSTRDEVLSFAVAVFWVSTIGKEGFP